MEICNSYYLIPNKKNQNTCIKLLENFFYREVLKEKKEGAVVNDLQTTARWIEFTAEYKNKMYKAFYKIYYGNAKDKKDSGFYLDIKINYQNNKRKYADVFSNIIQILKRYKKDDFYLVVLNDELSRYFTEISYKSLSVYERKLRQLFLVIIAPTDGKYWSGNLGDNKHNINSKEKNHIEEGLEKLNLSDFEDLFFEKVVRFDDSDYDKKFDIKNIEKLSKEEIIKIIKDNRPNAFWNMYIQEYIQIDNISTRMNNIRKQRNKIAHNKYFSSEDQKDFIKDVKYVSRKIDEAIQEIVNNKEKFNIKFMNIDLSSLEKVVKLTEKISKQYMEIISNVNIPILNLKNESLIPKLLENYLTDENIDDF